MRGVGSGTCPGTWKPGGQQFRGDHGDANRPVGRRLRHLAVLPGNEQAALTALAGTRLLVPVISVLAAPAGQTRMSA